MKNKILFLFTFVVFFSLHVKGEDDKTNKCDTVKVAWLAISKDTTIIVHELDSLKGIELYGDVMDKHMYGGYQYNQKKTTYEPTKTYNDYVIINGKEKGVSLKNNVKEAIKLEIKYEELEKDTLLLKFNCAQEYKNNEKTDYKIDEKKCVVIYICKIKAESASLIGDSDSDTEEGTANLPDVKTHSNPVKIYKKYIRLIIFILLFTLLIIIAYKVLIISRRLRMVYEKLDSANVQAKGNSFPKNETLNEKYIESLRKDILNQISAETNTLRNIIDTQSQVLSRQIMDMRSQLAFESSNTNIELPLLQQKEFETTDVKYNFEDNTFTLGKNEMNFFKIYARNENYFYTLIDDESMKKEFLKIIASYKECIEICDQSAFPKQVEPFEEGRLIREGERFIISKVLNVKLV